MKSDAFSDPDSFLGLAVLVLTCSISYLDVFCLVFCFNPGVFQPFRLCLTTRETEINSSVVLLSVF